MLLPPTDIPADDAYELLRRPAEDCEEIEPCCVPSLWTGDKRCAGYWEVLR